MLLLISSADYLTPGSDRFPHPYWEPFAVFTGEQLELDVMMYQSRWLADSSLLTRKSQWKKYFTFCDELGFIDPLPSTINMVLLYIAFMATHLAYVSLTNYLSALWSLHDLCDLPHVDPMCFRIRQTLLGVKRSLGCKSKKARPLLVHELRLIHASLNFGLSEDLAFWCGIIICFRGLLRKSNIVELGLAVVYGNVSRWSWGVSVVVDRTKTISFKERQLFLPYTRIQGSIFCLEYYLDKLVVSLGKVTPSTQVISYLNKQGVLVRGTYSWLHGRIAKMCVCLRLNNVTSHSLRRGGAAALHDAGVSVEDIKMIGDWKSSAFMGYISRTKDSRVNLDRHIVRLLFD